MADPVIHYTFDTDGTNSGTSGSTDNTSGTISTTNKFIGAGSLETTNETRSSIPKFNFTSSYTKGITFSFWLKHDGSVTDSYYLYSCHPSSTGYEGGSWNQLDTLSYNHSGTYLQLFSTDPNGVQGSNSSNQTDPITSAETAPIFDGNWHHIAVSYGNATLNLSNQRIRETTVYIDNTIVCYADDWVGGFPDNQNSIVIIGETYMNTEGTYSKPWKGNYDDFRMYDYALANSQITDVYKSGLIDSGLNLVSLVNSGTLTIADFFTRGYTVAQLFAIGFTQADIDIGLTNIKIHTAFTIKDGAQNESAFATDAVYTPATFAAKLTTDLGYTVTAGGDLTTTDSIPYYRLYLQFANAVTLTNMPKYIFNIPFSDFSVKAGGQVNLRNVSLDAAMVIDTSYNTTSNSSTIPAGNYFINDFVSTIGTDLNFTLSYDEPNKRIEFVGLAQDISMNITSSDTTIFDTSITEITTAVNTLPFITYGQPDPTLKNYSDNGITISEFISNGYTIPQLYKGGVIPDWTFDTDANHFNQSYVKDFIDISGSLALRENANLTVNGNIETKGNITIKNPTMTADLSLNHNMVVIGDISMNGNVTVGDISMNGNVFDCSFTDHSIPEAAFNGTIPGPDYTQPTIIYEKGFDTIADVSMNGNVQISKLKVYRNIEFNDGTTMNTYDDNIESGTLAQNNIIFKASTFTSLDISGNLTAASFSTPSDYRIKTDISQLDETTTLDNLRPVKYLQTLINKPQYGLIAHELQEYYPDLVVGEKDGKEWQRVNYTGLIALLINEIKQLKRELTELENGM